MLRKLLACGLLVAVMLGVASNVHANTIPVTAGLKLWLDATDSATLSDAAGRRPGEGGFAGSVSRWADKSGNGQVATAGNGPLPYDAAALNGRPTLTFSGSWFSLDKPITTSEETIIVVTRMFDNGDNRGSWVGQRTGSNGFANDNNRYFFPTTSGWGYLLGESAPTNDTIVVSARNSASAKVYENGGAVINTAGFGGNLIVDAVGVWGHGGYRTFLGEISEILIYDRVLSADELNAIGFALASKYGLTTSYAPPVILSPAWLSLAEGNTGTYTVTLAQAPSADVVISLTGDNQMNVFPSSLTFTTANWNQPQTVSVQAIADQLAEGSYTSFVKHAISSADPGYNGLMIDDVAVSIADDQLPVTAGLKLWLDASDSGTLSDASGRRPGQAGFAGSISRWTDKSGDGHVATAGNGPLQYDSAALNGRPTLTFSGSWFSLDKPITTSEETVIVVTRMFDNGDNRGSWVGQRTGSNGFANDNDRYFFPTTSGWGYLLSESAPTSDMIVVSARNGANAKVYENGGAVINTAGFGGNLIVDAVGVWGHGGYRTFLGEISEILIYDRVLSADELNAIGAALATKYGLTTSYVPPVSTTPAGVTLSQTALSLTEGGLAGSYTVALTKAPTSDVTVSVVADSQVKVFPASVTFTAANWNSPQTVSVQAVQDGMAEGAHRGIVRHSVTSADASYHGLNISDLTVAIGDAIAPSLQFPSGSYWTASDLPLTGTAGAGATVLVTASSLSTGEARSLSVVAASNGSFRLTFAGLTDGRYELFPESNGIQGSKVMVWVDSHAPVSTLSVSPAAPGASGWYTAPVSLGISGADGVGGSGLADSEYTLGSGSWSPFPASLVLSAEGSHNFCYRSLDKAGNVEADRCVALKIDATGPTVTPQFDTARNALSLNVQDAGSGVASIEISRDGGSTWSPVSGPIAFDKDGSYTVQYRAKDAAGNQTSGQTTVKVVTAPAIVTADQAANEGEAQSFNLGSFTDQAMDNPWSVEVDWGDGSALTVFSVNAVGSLGGRSHTFADNGVYTVTLKITDQAGNTGVKSFKVAVANIAPAAGFTATPGQVNEGDMIGLAFSNPADLSPVDTAAGFRYAFDCGDGKGYGAFGAASSATCPALDNPGQVVKGKVQDKDGGSAEYSTATTISNLPPTLGAVSGPSSPELRGTPITLDTSFTDLGIKDSHTVSVDWDDGSTSAGAVTETNGAGTATATHSYANPGRYTVTLTLTDKDGGAATATYTIQIRGGGKGGPPKK